MISRLLQLFEKKRFMHVAKKVLATPPLDMQKSNPVFVSMLCKRDVIPYLVAIKSVYSRIGAGSVLIVNDGSLDEDNIATLKQHIPNIEFRDINKINTGPCPRGGTWERLLTLVDVSQNNYAIQVDADIVALSPLPEVIDHIENNRGFALTNLLRPGIVNLASAAQYTRDSSWSKSTHVQTLAETNLDHITGSRNKKYLRGSSAFTGLPKGAVSRGDAEYFSNEMHRILGDKWLEWGSEQVTSSYLIANTENAVELPCPKYANSMPHIDVLNSALGHFFGTNRFIDNRYRKAAAIAIDHLMSPT